jgi:beta-lactamase class A
MAKIDFFKKHRKFTSFLIFLFVFLLGVFSDQVVNHIITSSEYPSPVREKGYLYVSPLLYCRYPNPENDKLISKLYSDLAGYVNEENNKKITQNISIYFHEPNNGEWMSVNGSDQYAIASLVKVPLMMMIYKQAETNPTLLSMKLQFNGTNDNSMENFKPTGHQEIHQGNSYTVDDLVTRMIDYSDNSAMNLLTSQIQLNEFNDDLEQLNFSPIQGNSQTDIDMTVGKYATFFRILYNATYLDPAMSEKALKMLTRTTFNSGLAAGVPKGIAIAHKFGERAYDDAATKELHDCGIIYFPNHPYILCVMTKGTDFNSLESVIQTISKKTYDNVNAAY